MLHTKEGILRGKDLKSCVGNLFLKFLYNTKNSIGSLQLDRVNKFRMVACQLSHGRIFKEKNVSKFHISSRSLSLNYYGVDPLFVCLCLFFSVSLTFLKQDFIHENLIYHFPCHQNSIFSKLYNIRHSIHSWQNYILVFFLTKSWSQLIFTTIENMASPDKHLLWNWSHHIRYLANLKNRPCVLMLVLRMCTLYVVKINFHVGLENAVTLYALKSTFILPLRNVVLCMFLKPN